MLFDDLGYEVEAALDAGGIGLIELAIVVFSDFVASEPLRLV